MKITKKQIITLYGTDHGDTKLKLKEWFPEAFETVLEVGKWYSYRAYNDFRNDGICFVTEKPVLNKKLGFGINGRKEWKGEFIYLEGYVFREATESEVFEDLKNEAVKRYKSGNFVNCLRNGNLSLQCELILEKFSIYFQNNQLWVNYNDKESKCPETMVCVFDGGKWAEIIPTITKEEAELLIGKKIV